MIDYRKLHILGITVAMLIIFFVGVGTGAKMTETPVIVMGFDTEILDKAVHSHGIGFCRYYPGDEDSEGIFTFERDSMTCSVFNIPFRKDYRDEIVELFRSKNITKELYDEFRKARKEN